MNLAVWFGRESRDGARDDARTAPPDEFEVLGTCGHASSSDARFVLAASDAACAAVFGVLRHVETLSAAAELALSTASSFAAELPNSAGCVAGAAIFWVNFGVSTGAAAARQGSAFGLARAIDTGLSGRTRRLTAKASRARAATRTATATARG